MKRSTRISEMQKFHFLDGVLYLNGNISSQLRAEKLRIKCPGNTSDIQIAIAHDTTPSLIKRKWRQAVG
jgi:hypothetical protein